jgi:uncharacterized protein YjbJ (UPF0337 family)
MDKDRRRIGEGDQGKFKEAVGKAVGDAKLEAEGKADKAEDKVRTPSAG